MDNIVQVPNERIIERIILIRGKKVMFDKDLAELYGVETRAINQAVKRNLERFPEDFAFILTPDESRLWLKHYSRSQSVILNQGANIKYRPTVFTEQGVAMLSSVLRSSVAIQVNIQIIRTFAKLREILSQNKALAEKIETMEKKYDSSILEIFRAIKSLRIQETKEEPKNTIGFSV